MNKHKREHTYSRRQFLSRAGLVGGASFLLGGMPLNSLFASPLGKALTDSTEERVLVLIQLQGGNDGLNTVIPLHDYGFYQSVRPRLAIKENEVIKLADDLGIAPYMQPLQHMWNAGQMRIVRNVGYPLPNLSHFRSTDIWNTASDSEIIEGTGWMGRFLDSQYPDFVNSPPKDPPAIQIGVRGSLLFQGGKNNLSVSVADPEQLAEIAQAGSLYDPNDTPANCYGNEVKFMRTLTNSTFVFADAIQQAYDRGKNQAEYPTGTEIGDQLAMVARLIKGGLQTKIYLVSLDGFDTHANQRDAHPFLWNELSTAIQRFFADLGAAGVDNKVLAMTFSEFGRTIGENGSRGTDHGSAAPLMLFGPAVNGNGVTGTAPDLRNTDADGNLQFTTDFRSVYATVLENWICIDKPMVDGVMGQSFDRMDSLGIDCSPVQASNINPGVVHHVRYNYAQRQAEIHFLLPSEGKTEVNIHNIMGQRITQLHRGNMAAGSHQVNFSFGNYRIHPGVYVYQITSKGDTFSGKIVVK